MFFIPVHFSVSSVPVLYYLIILPKRCQRVPDGSVVKTSVLGGMKYTVHDLEVKDSNSGQVELGLHSSSV